MLCRLSLVISTGDGALCRRSGETPVLAVACSPPSWIIDLTVTLVPPLALLLLFQTPVAPAPDTPPFAPRTALQQGFDRLTAAGNDHNRFTFFESERIVAFDPIGTKRSDVTRTFEVTWINGLPYLRLVKLNDQPLSAKDEKKEQKLYDQAVAQRHPLGLSERNKLGGYHQTPLDWNIHDVLGPNYLITENYVETSGDQVDHIVEARLLPAAESKSMCPWHYMFWISDKEPFIHRLSIDAAGDKSPLCHDTREETTYGLVEGVPKSLRSTIRFHFNNDVKNGTTINDFTYTNYRRFQTTVTIRSVGVPPPDPASQPASPSPHTIPQP